MRINTISGLNYSSTYKPQTKKSGQSDIENHNYGRFSYPKVYYTNQISFGRKFTAVGLINQIGEENFPNPKIVQTLKDIGDTYDYSLHKIHLDYYKNLMSCNTLEEAKEKYPEFKDVIDAKDVDVSSFDKKSLLYKISKGEIPDIDINNLTLEILKRYYGQLHSTAKKKEYWGFTYPALIKVFKALNIKFISNQYTVTASLQTAEYQENASQAIIKKWQDPEYREKQIQERNSKEGRARMTRISRNLWQDPKFIEKRRQATSTEEYREKMSQRVKKLWQDPDSVFNSKEHREKMSQVSSAMWKNPEFREKYHKTTGTDDYKDKLSKLKKAQWQDPNSAFNSAEFKEKMSKTKKAQHQDPNSAYNSEEYRKLRSLILSNLWLDDEYREKQTKGRSTEEYKEKTSQTTINQWQDPDYQELMKNVYKAKNEAFNRHPEIRNMMIEVAKSFPRLGEIRKKEKKGIELTEEEKAYSLAYFKECEQRMPGYNKIIGKEQHKILIEWGLEEES